MALSSCSQRWIKLEFQSTITHVVNSLLRKYIIGRSTRPTKHSNSLANVNFGRAGLKAHSHCGRRRATPCVAVVIKYIEFNGAFTYHTTPYDAARPMSQKSRQVRLERRLPSYLPHDAATVRAASYEFVWKYAPYIEILTFINFVSYATFRTSSIELLLARKSPKGISQQKNEMCSSNLDGWR
jgi:hypothetical protein